LRNVGSISFLVLYEIIDARHAAPPGPQWEDNSRLRVAYGRGVYDGFVPGKSNYCKLYWNLRLRTGQTSVSQLKGGLAIAPPVYTTI